MTRTNRVSTRARRALALGALIALIAQLTGCLSEPLQPQSAPAPARAQVNLPPKQAVEQVKRVVSEPPLSLGVTEELDGVVVTGWERHRGNFHIGRHWQERTRYRIAVVPDWNEPTQRARIEVGAQTEERAAEGQTWTPAPQIHRPERAKAVLDKIVPRLGGASGG